LTAQMLDLPIGSGMIESGHRHVLQARLKKAGTAWLPNNADDLAQLRVLRANEQWQAFWN
ncbi:MAG: ISKra4 family transposase, partial [Verrucomicrobiales bacterium]